MSEIIFYGAGQNAREKLVQWAGKGLVPVCFADADVKKHHTTFMGLDVLPLFEAVSRYPDYVLYCTQNPAGLFAVREFLMRVGIPEERIKFCEEGGVPAAAAMVNTLYPQMLGIYQALQDDLSRAWFWGRLEYSLSHHLTSVYRTMLRPDHLQWASQKQSFGKEFFGLSPLWDLLKENYPLQKHKIYLLVSDQDWNEYNWVVERFLDAMPGLGIEISGCIMPYTDPQISEFLGLPRLSETEVFSQMDPQTRIIIGFPGWCSQIQDVINRYPEHKDIFFAIGDTIYPQYIEPEMFPPAEDEIYVDIGVFDLGSSIDFARWATKGYQKIYAFEPDPKCYQNALKRLGEMDEEFRLKTELVPMGLSAADGVLEFPAEYKASGAPVSGTIPVQVVSLDSYLKGAPITLAKMDVEGAEMDVLLGMQETIRKYKPRLEVCVYHKHEDLLAITSFLLDLVPEYKFFIRHYGTYEVETVLFCTI